MYQSTAGTQSRGMYQSAGTRGRDMYWGKASTRGRSVYLSKTGKNLNPEIGSLTLYTVHCTLPVL